MTRTPIGVHPSERDMLDLLHKRYGQIDNAGTRRYVMAEQVRNAAGFAATRTCDMIAMDTWPGNPRATRLAFHGHEIKCSRADWRTELKDPLKAEAFRPYCDYWWLVIADAVIIKDGELPEGWGLLVRRGSGLRVVCAARKIEAKHMPRTMIAPLLRSVQNTAERRARILMGEHFRAGLPL